MPRAAGSLLVLLAAAAACGTTSGTGRGASDVLTRAEIETSSSPTAYELLRELRPRFLRSRTVISVEDPSQGYAVVYVDNARRGDIETLRSIPVDDVAEIRYISAPDATTRWGTGHAGGVIHVRGR